MSLLQLNFAPAKYLCKVHRMTHIRRSPTYFLTCLVSIKAKCTNSFSHQFKMKTLLVIISTALTFAKEHNENVLQEQLPKELQPDPNAPRPFLTLAPVELSIEPTEEELLPCFNNPLELTSGSQVTLRSPGYPNKQTEPFGALFG